MKNYYLVLSIFTILAVGALSVGTMSFAQSTTNLVCSVGTATRANEVAILTATGGTGSYVWSGQNIDITNTAGNQFAVSYPNAGTYPITVTSGSQSAICSVTFTSAASTGSLFCSPAVQTVRLGQTASFSANGGNGTFTWSSPDLSIANPNGSGFSASYASVGLKTLTVMSGSAVSTCATNVLPNFGTTVPTTPGFPSTGGGFGQ